MSTTDEDEIVMPDGEVIPSPPPPNIATHTEPAQTVMQARTDSVARMLDAAYQRASLLTLTPEESAKLTADFPDDEIRTGAKGKSDLLYVEAASVRNRMLSVFGPGQWVPVCRRMWTEEYPTQKGIAIRVYTEVVLLIRGCYVGEAIGAGSYFPSNPQQDYSDAAEAAQSEALRRICGKNLGVGLQLWNKAWCEAWKQRRSRPQQRQPEPAKPKPPANWHDLREALANAAVKLTADGFPVAEAALQSSVLAIMSTAGVMKSPDKWNESEMKIAIQAAKDACHDIRHPRPVEPLPTSADEAYLDEEEIDPADAEAVERVPF